MACCPFHDDKHPSMKVDRRFHCFGCQADGDVIDFTARLFGLNKKEAALKLAEDFSVSFDAKGHDPPRRRPVKRKISEELRYRQAEQKCFRVLCDYLHLLERWEKEYAPQTPEETWNPLFVEALQKKPYTEYLLDILLSGSMEEGILTEQRFMKLTAALEQEQEANQKRLHDLAMMQSRADAQESEVRTFIKEIWRYAAIEELDESVLNRLISKILIGEVKKLDGQKVQEVRIVYNFVGEIPEIAA